MRPQDIQFCFKKTDALTLAAINKYTITEKTGKVFISEESGILGNYTPFNPTDTWRAFLNHFTFKTIKECSFLTRIYHNLMGIDEDKVVLADSPTSLSTVAVEQPNNLLLIVAKR